jgi:hypothetical protein
MAIPAVAAPPLEADLFDEFHKPLHAFHADDTSHIDVSSGDTDNTLGAGSDSSDNRNDEDPICIIGLGKDLGVEDKGEIFCCQKALTDIFLCSLSPSW